MQNFDIVFEDFKNKKLDFKKWNFCVCSNYGKYDAYIMGEGAEQCLAVKRGFDTKEEIVALYQSLGVTRILPI